MRIPKKIRKARLDMLALMDVVFLVLIFLVYAMMTMAELKGMPVTLPSSKSAMTERNVVLSLTIQQNGNLWLDKTPVSLEELAEKLNRSALQDKADIEEPAIQIFADAQLPYQKLFEVLDVLKRAGLKKISLQASPANGK